MAITMIVVVALFAGGVGGVLAAAVYIKSGQQSLLDNALELRRAARRLESERRKKIATRSL